MRKLRFLNVSNMDVTIIDIGSRGAERAKMTSPGEKVNISDEGYFDQMEDNIFKHGYLVFVGKGDLPNELEDNPNHLTDKEVDELVNLTIRDAEARIDEIDSPITLRRLYDKAQKRGLMEYLSNKLFKNFGVDLDRENQTNL